MQTRRFWSRLSIRVSACQCGAAINASSASRTVDLLLFESGPHPNPCMAFGMKNCLRGRTPNTV
eukprot:10520698-Alexandrium_andersonii.AAC.1